MTNVEHFLFVFQVRLLGVKNSRMRLLSEAFKNKEVPVKLGIFLHFIHLPVRLLHNMPVKLPSLFTLSQLLTHLMPDLPEIVLIMNNLFTITAQNNLCYSKMFPYIPIYGLFMEYNLLYLLHFLIIYCLHIQKQQLELQLFAILMT